MKLCTVIVFCSLPSYQLKHNARRHACIFTNCMPAVLKTRSHGPDTAGIVARHVTVNMAELSVP